MEKINWSEKGTTKKKKQRKLRFRRKREDRKREYKNKHKKENNFFGPRHRNIGRIQRPKKEVYESEKGERNEKTRGQKRESRWKEDEQKEGIKRKRSHFRRTTWKTDERKTEKKMRPKNIKHEVLPIMYFSKKAKIKECEKDDFSYLLFFQVFWEEKNEKKEKTQRNFSLKGPTRNEHSFC